MTLWTMDATGNPVPEHNPKAWRDWMRANRAALRIKSSHVNRRPKKAPELEVRSWVAKTGGTDEHALTKALGTCSVTTWFCGKDVRHLVKTTKPMPPVPLVYLVAITGKKVKSVGYAVASTRAGALQAHQDALLWLKRQLNPDPKPDGVLRAGSVMLSTQPAEIQVFGQVPKK